MKRHDHFQLQYFHRFSFLFFVFVLVSYKVNANCIFDDSILDDVTINFALLQLKPGVQDVLNRDNIDNSQIRTWFDDNRK